MAEFLNWLLEVAPQRKREKSPRGFRKRMGWHGNSPRVSNPARCTVLSASAVIVRDSTVMCMIPFARA